MSVVVAAAQIFASANIGENIAKLDRYAKKASNKGAKIIATPEMYLPSYSNINYKENAAIIPTNYCYSINKIQHNILDSIAKICIKYNIDIITGLTELDVMHKIQYYNSCIWMSNEGKLRTIYRKTHLWGKWEHQTWQPYTSYNNTEYKIIECYGLKFGLLICFDIEFCEPSRILALNGCDCIFVPTALMINDSETNTELNITDIFPQCRAAENTIYIVHINFPNPQFCGNSSISAPNGQKIANAGVKDELLVCELNPKKYNSYRKRNDYLNLRRPQLYQRLVCKL